MSRLNTQSISQDFVERNRNLEGKKKTDGEGKGRRGEEEEGRRGASRGVFGGHRFRV